MILILYNKNKHCNFVHDRGMDHLDVIPNYIYVKEKFLSLQPKMFIITKKMVTIILESLQ